MCISIFWFFSKDFMSTKLNNFRLVKLFLLFKTFAFNSPWLYVESIFNSNSLNIISFFVLLFPLIKIELIVFCAFNEKPKRRIIIIPIFFHVKDLEISLMIRNDLRNYCLLHWIYMKL